MESSTDNEGSVLVDPLADYSPLSLVSRSLNLFSSSTHHISNPNSSVSDSLYARLKAKVLSSPNKLMKQATSILEGNSDHLQADKSEAVTDNEKVPRGRRPGLGLKRPKFSIKPMPSSQPDVSLESSMDFDKLSDPDEFFDAFERMENAKKEVAKLKGESVVDVDQYRASLAQKRRRPSLLGKSYTYTHRPSLSKVDVDEILLPSQETHDNDIQSPARHDVVPDANVTRNSSSMRVSDSKATTTSKVSELDELLSCSFEGLDEGGVQNLLLDKLQIKSVDISEDILPDWHASLHESLSTSTALPKSYETVSHISGANLATSSKDKKSPAKSRSPLASISMLNRQIARLNPSDDLFPSLRFDSTPVKATNPARESEKRVDQAGQSDENDARSTMCNVRSSPVHGEKDTAVTSEDSFVSAGTGVDQISEPKEKEVVGGQHDQIVNQTELRGNKSSLEPKEREVVGGKHGQIGNDSSDELFPSLRFDSSLEKVTNPTRESEKRVDQAGQSDENDARSTMCNVRSSPVHGEKDTAVTGADPVISAKNGVDQISEPKEKEVVGGQHDQTGNKPELRENARSPVHGEENIVGVDLGPASEPENQNIEVAAVRESAWKQNAFEAQDMENSNLNEDVPVSKEIRSKRKEAERAGPGRSKGGRKSSLYSGVDVGPASEPENQNNEVAAVRGSAWKQNAFEAQDMENFNSNEDVPVSKEISSKRREVERAGPEQSKGGVSKEIRSKRRKVERAGPGQSKGERRFSLHNAGMNWDHGVRRSSRVRMAPLNFWEGERVYYGRVHETLPTMIAVKYSSPSKDADLGVKLKVKSFVSDEYKDLLDKVV